MKNLKIFLIGFFILQYSITKAQFKAGFLDKTGKEVITAQFESASSFSQGLAAVKINGKWGYIDKTGKIVLEPTYGYALDFKKYENQIAAIVTIKGNNIYINKSGIEIEKPLIEIAANELRPFSDNDFTWGYKDKNGKIIVPAIYTLTLPFEGGLGAVIDSDKAGLINAAGKIVLPVTQETMPTFSDGVIVIKRNGNFEIVNEKLIALVVLDKIPNLQQCTNFQSGLAAIQVNEKWGAINKKGEVVIKPEYEDSFVFYDGVAKAKKDGVIGLINTTGEPIGNVMDKDYWGFKDGLSVYRPMGQPGQQYQGFIDKTGTVVIPVQYIMLESFSEGLAKFVKKIQENLETPEIANVIVKTENTSSSTSSSAINIANLKTDLNIIIKDATTGFQESKSGFIEEKWEGKYYHSNNTIFKSDRSSILYREEKIMKHSDNMPEAFFYLIGFSLESKEGIFISENIETIFDELAIPMKLKGFRAKVDKKDKETCRNIYYENNMKQRFLEFYIDKKYKLVQIKIFSDLRPTDLPKYQGCLIVYNFQSGKVVGVSLNYVYGESRPDSEKLYYIMKPKIENQYTNYDKYEFTARNKGQVEDFLAPFGNIQILERSISPDGNNFIDN